MWRPTLGAPSGQVSRRRGSGRATFPGMERERERRASQPLTERTAERTERTQVDLGTIGLAVYFVALIAIVGLLLLLPAIF